MKNVVHLVVVLLVTVQLNSQEKRIDTESVTLDNLITFIVEHFNEDNEDNQNVTFLVKTYNNDFTEEDKIILKQAFILLSRRMQSDDFLSIGTYSGYNGIALKQTQAKDLKKILYAIEHPKTSIKTFGEDGIEIAYDYTKDNFVEDYENKVVMIRMPKRSKNRGDKLISEAKPKNGNGAAVVLSALALLPEIISVIKN